MKSSKVDLKNLFNEKNTSKIVEILGIGLIIFIAYILFLNNSYSMEHYNNSDVQRGFQRGIDVLNGVNSYLDFNPDRMLLQEKVPGFFPTYFIFMAGIARISDYSFVLFVDNLRFLIFLCYVSIGLVIYWHTRSKGKILAAFLMILFMFNRWTLDNVLALKQESYVLLILLISLLNLKKHKYLSFFLYGLATSIKHLTILIFPLYLYELILPFLMEKFNISGESFKKKLASLLVGGIFLSAPIILPSIPYYLDSPRHYVNSILYNLTRESEQDQPLRTGFDKILVLYNQDNESTSLYLLPRLPLLVSMILITAAFFKYKLDKWKYALLTYIAFVSFNPTLFPQYYLWFIVFIPMAAFTNESNMSRS